MKRQEGYYWVKLQGSLTVAECWEDFNRQMVWFTPGRDYHLVDADFEWISDSPIPEPKVEG